MSDTLPPNAGVDRVTALEFNLVHLKEMMVLRAEGQQKQITELAAQMRVLELEIEKRDERQARETEKIRDLIGSVSRWLGTTLIVTLSTIILKALKLI